MDCCICTNVDNSYICDACNTLLRPLLVGTPATSSYEFGAAGADSILNQRRRLLGNPQASHFASYTTNKAVINSLRLVKTLMQESKVKCEYLTGLVEDFRKLFDTDVQVLAGKNGTAKPAHKEILAQRSNRLKTILVGRDIDKITLPDLNEEELTCLLDFIYKGELSKVLFKKHLYSLSLASHHYGIPFLAKSCEKELMEDVSIRNVLQVLKISDTCSMLKSKKFALDFISKNMDEIAFTAEYEAFVTQNPKLNLELTRANVKRQKTNQNDSSRSRRKLRAFPMMF